MSKKEILMPVIAINDKCISCPELEIDIARKQLDVYDKDDQFVGHKYENLIYCKHYEKCRLILSTTIPIYKDVSQI